jgi:alpha-tubulin suppressor-like RCC1 family protein
MTTPLASFSAWLATWPAGRLRLLALLTLWLSLSLGAAHAQHVAAGSTHSAAIHPDGTLWTWGGNFSGGLGDGTTTTRGIPAQVGTANNWQSVAAGTFYTLAIRTDGTLWGWGNNGSGQLGSGAYGGNDHTTPMQIGTATNWRSVSAGEQHALAIRTDGTLWAWGWNNDGQLGDGTRENRYAPTQIGTATTWKSVSAGSSNTLAVRTDGTLWAWGSNIYGQLGTGTVDYDTHLMPVQIGTATNWQSVAAGFSYTMAVRTDGTLWAWGQNDKGQLGNGTISNYNSQTTPAQIGTATNWQSVAAGFSHTMALRTDGTLWAWGESSEGQLGDGTTTTRGIPAQVGTAHNWESVSVGGFQTVAARADGTLWAWGRNTSGEVGSAALVTAIRPSPQQIGAAGMWQSMSASTSYTLAVRTNGTLWAWGQNFDGQLGDGTTTQRYVPTQIGTASTWKSVAASTQHSVALRTNGTLWAWGSNFNGQLGDGTTTDHLAPVQIGTATNWQSIAAGPGYTMAIRTDGTLWAWGSNSSGELGDGTTVNRSAPVQIGTATNWVAIATGGKHTVAVRTDGTLWTWGDNRYGQLGNGSYAPSSPSVPVQIGTATNWQSIAAGSDYTVAVRTDGTLWAWGSNSYGQFGEGTTSDYLQGTPMQVGTATNWQSVAAGGQHAVAIRSGGMLWAWGLNSSGQLGDGTTTNHLPPAQIGNAANWQSVAVGAYHSVALRADGTLWTWGDNTFGQLGDGLPMSSSVPLLIFGSPLATTPSRAAALSLYPNPAHDQVQLPGLGATTQLRLLDAQGRLVRTGAGPRLSLRGLAPGLYLLHAGTPGQAGRTARLVVE